MSIAMKRTSHIKRIRKRRNKLNPVSCMLVAITIIIESLAEEIKVDSSSNMPTLAKMVVVSPPRTSKCSNEGPQQQRIRQSLRIKQEIRTTEAVKTWLQMRALLTKANNTLQVSKN